jgi:hypothetical protein
LFWFLDFDYWHIPLFIVVAPVFLVTAVIAPTPFGGWNFVLTSRLMQMMSMTTLARVLQILHHHVLEQKPGKTHYHHNNNHKHCKGGYKNILHLYWADCRFVVVSGFRET